METFERKCALDLSLVRAFIASQCTYCSDKQSVDSNVGEDYPRDVEFEGVESPVDEAETDEKQQYGHECGVHACACLHHEMVDVGLVGIKHSLAVFQSEECHSDDIDAGNEYERPGDEQ